MKTITPRATMKLMTALAQYALLFQRSIRHSFRNNFLISKNDMITTKILKGNNTTIKNDIGRVAHRYASLGKYKS